MFPKEASWFFERISEVDPELVFPLLNLGSSTEYFRTVMQPYIESELFKPLRDQKRSVIHSDLKAAAGIDLIGDVTSERFLQQLRGLGIRSILCSHLLEHVMNPTAVAHAMSRLIPVGGYIFVSCPFRYPHHPDPIDTMFRPTAKELALLFPNTRVVHAVTITDGRYGKFGNTPRSASRELLRMLMPFYKPSRWLWHFRETSGTCLVLQKSS